MKIVTIVGARPQFIKAATVSRVISVHHKDDLKEVIVHTGQHFDEKMSEIFFKEMDIPEPDYNLGINSMSHGAMTGQMLEKIEELLLREKPDLTLVYGDTNTTLAGALAAVKIHIPVAHVEAGLRSFNMHMPEEINRVVTDRVSSLLFCPTPMAIKNLKAEGYPNRLYDGKEQKVLCVGDVMYDAALFYSGRVQKEPDILKDLKLKKGEFVLCTIHRSENTDNRDRLKEILLALSHISKSIEVVLPLHPRTGKIIDSDVVLKDIASTLKIIEPVGYFDMISLIMSCQIVMTDSGGLQKEAYFFKKYCITMRDETEWIELVEHSVNFLAGAKRDTIISIYENISSREFVDSNGLYGDGKAAEKVVESILKYVG